MGREPDVSSEQEFLGSTSHDLDAVEVSLRRLDEGTYGLCEVCGQPVGEDRLAISPVDRFCSAHQPPDGAGS